MSTPSVSPGAPLLELAAARIELHELAVADSLTVRVTGPRVVIVGDATPLFAPLFGTASVVRGWYKALGLDLATLRPSLGLAPLDPPLPPAMTPLEYVSWSARLAGMTVSEAASAAAKWCARVGLGDSARTAFDRLPIVPKRLTMLAHAMVASPKLVVIDNPLWRLNPDEAYAVLGAMGQLGGDGGCPRVLVSTGRFDPGSPGDALARGADELLLILDGELIEQGTPDELARRAQGDTSSPKLEAEERVVPEEIAPHATADAPNESNPAPEIAPVASEDPPSSDAP